MIRISIQSGIAATALVLMMAIGPLSGCAAEDEAPAATGLQSASASGSGGQGGGVSSGVGGSTSGGPRVLSSDPAEGWTTYAVEMLVKESVNRKLLVVTFSEEMDVTTATLPLRSLKDTRDVPLVWSNDGTTATVDVPLRTFDTPALRPLAYDASYRLDLTGLRSRAGAPLDTTAAPLGDGVLDFETFPEDRLLEHTCGHINDQVELTSGLSAAANGLPAIGIPHERYLLLFPPGAASGYAYMAPPSVVPFDTWEYTAFLTEDVKLDVTERETGQPVAVTGYPVPHVCSGLRFARRFLASEKPSTVMEPGYDLVLSGEGFSSFEVFFERRAQ